MQHLEVAFFCTYVNLHQNLSVQMLRCICLILNNLDCSALGLGSCGLDVQDAALVHTS